MIVVFAVLVMTAALLFPAIISAFPFFTIAALSIPVMVSIAAIIRISISPIISVS